jgi:two-component system, NtrC family, sensor kinase
MELTVSDDGCGIPEALKEKLFKPFFTTDTTGQGTGLGLWITKMMVERLQGELSIESKEGEGTRFAIRLPITEREWEGQSGLHRNDPAGR